MARKTLAKVRIALLEEDGELIRVNPEKLDDEEREKVQLEEREVYLLHWGIDHDKLYDSEGMLHIGHYTIGVCQDKRTGQIWSCLIHEITILGSQYII